MNMKLVFLLTISFIHSITCWMLKSTYNSTNFVDQFRFFSKNYPSRGLALYQDETNAVSKGLIQMNNQSALIKPNNKTVSSEDRESVRLHSKESYNHGLFIIDLNHIPTGCGVWPAFWLTGKSWGQNGEIDVSMGILENKLEKNFNKKKTQYRLLKT
jgi:beta-glucanase (GH16 family)